MIHQKGLEYSDSLLKKLQEGALKQQKKVFALFRADKSAKLRAEDVQDLLYIKRITSARRAVTNLTDDDPDNNRHLDEYGQQPLKKLPEKVWNSDKTAKVHQWTWNPKYGKPPQTGQMDAFGAPDRKPKFRNGVAGL